MERSAALLSLKFLRSGEGTPIAALDHPQPARSQRLQWIATTVLLACIPVTQVSAFTLEDVVGRAQKLAAAPFRPPPPIPAVMQKVGYDQHRGIRYRKERNLWRESGSGFEVSLVMPGNVYRHAVPLNEVDGTTVRRIPFRKQNFSYDDADLARRIPADLGYAGFELSYPMHEAGVPEQFFVFAGASYFRGIGKAGQFGLSVRGAAIDTGLPSGEEFPDFVEFWLVRPPANATSMTVYALLDSRRLAGAYEFVIAPGEPTRVDVRTVLFARERIEMLGIAPLTSMYFYGENSQRPLGAWRPEIHDSDGLAIASRGGEWLWQPLLNPSVITISNFPAADTRTFGLLQRDHEFASYEDPGTKYHLRPSGTVDLIGGFDAGRVVLVQLPSDNEFLDNIVAFWSPTGAVAAQTRLALQYRLNFGEPEVAQSPLARVVHTFVGRDVNAVSALADRQRFIVDFAGGPLDELETDAPVAAIITPSADVGVLEYQLERLEAANVWRLSILTRSAADKLLSLRAGLTLNGRRLSELWSYELEAGNVLRQPR